MPRLLHTGILVIALITATLAHNHSPLTIDELVEKQMQLTKDMFEVIEEKLSEQEAVLQEQITYLEARVAEVETISEQRLPSNIDEGTTTSSMDINMIKLFHPACPEGPSTEGEAIGLKPELRM